MKARCGPLRSIECHANLTEAHTALNSVWHARHTTMFRMPLLFSGLRRFVDVMRRAAGQEHPRDFGWGVNAPLPPEAKKILKI